MFALFSTISLPAGALAIGGAVIAGLVGLAILGAGTFLIARMVKNRKAAKAGTPATPAATPKASTPLGTLLGNLGHIDLANLPPEVKQIIGVLLPAIHEAQQSAVKLAVAKMFPGLAPIIFPVLSKGIADLDNVIDNKLGIGQGQGGGVPSAPSAPASTPTTPVLIPTGHPILDILRGAVEAHQAKVAGK